MIWYLAFRLATFLVRHLPRRWGLAVMRGLGTIIYHISPMAEAVRDNFRHVLGPDADPKRVSQLTKQSFQERLFNYYDMLWLPGQSMENIDLRSACEGLEIVDQLEQGDRGAIIVSGHLGPIEFLIQSVASLGYNVFAIFEHLDNERLLAYMMELRATHGLEIMSTRGPLLNAYRRIKKGAILLSGMDRDSTNTGLIVDFFGAQAWMPDGYARLAVRADVPVIFGYGRYTENGAGAKLFPPIYPDQTLGKELAVRQIVQQTVQLLEEVIRKDPGAWHLSTPVWKLAHERQELGPSL